MTATWHILYRGPLSSCNYACPYCPFAKTRNTREELRDDAARLQRFVDWVGEQRSRRIGILFTPWGEALFHPAYQKAIVRLTRMPHVYRAAIQTNLSCSLDWLESADLDAAALWATWHPTQVPLDRFLDQCRRLDALGVRYSVGVVGFKEAMEDIQAIRARLRPDVYLWINAYKRDPAYYLKEDLSAFAAIDPWFRTNAQYHPSLGKRCYAGETSFTVDGEGDLRRCHFVKEPPLGNIYQPGFESCLRPLVCPNDTCGCHIGYVHLKELGLYDTYGDGLLERIPQANPR